MRIFAQTSCYLLRQAASVGLDEVMATVEEYFRQILQETEAPTADGIYGALPRLSEHVDGEVRRVHKTLREQRRSAADAAENGEGDQTSPNSAGARPGANGRSAGS